MAFIYQIYALDVWILGLIGEGDRRVSYCKTPPPKASPLKSVQIPYQKENCQHIASVMANRLKRKRLIFNFNVSKICVKNKYDVK